MQAGSSAQTHGAVSTSYATGAVGGGGALGGLVGVDTLGCCTAGSLDSYWDILTTGRTTSAGGTGLTTAIFQSGVLPVDSSPPPGPPAPDCTPI